MEVVKPEYLDEDLFKNIARLLQPFSLEWLLFSNYGFSKK